MDRNQFEVELTFTENAETLWRNFEKTGSVKDYLRYVQKLESVKDLDSTTLPS